MKARFTRRIVAAGILTGGFLYASPPAQGKPVIYVVPSGTISTASYGEPAAYGFYVAGAGGAISRQATIASLRRGKVESVLLGGQPSGKVLADLAFRPPPPGSPRPIAYVELPPSGTGRSTNLYPVAFVGGGYRGLLTSDATRIRGLVPPAEIAPSLVAIEQGDSPDIESEADNDPVAELRSLENRIAAIKSHRGWTLTAVIFTLLALVAFVPRAAVLGGAAAMSGSLLLSWAGATRQWVLIVVMVAATIGFALAGSARRRFIPAAVAVFFGAYLLVLALSPETNSLAVLGARPDGGGRFYGMTNVIETLLLPAFIAGVAVGGRRWIIPLGALALVTVGWSKAGADGGGILVFGTALAVLTLTLVFGKVTARRLALAAAAVVLLALALVGLDAALGGSSHVTRAVGTGPGSLLGDFGHRLHLSWESATESWDRIVIFVGCVALLVWMGTMRPRRPTVDAMLAALAVSLLVNDTPVDVVGLGALGCGALLRWESVDSRAMRRGALTVACLLAVLALAGCGEEGVVRPLPETVVGTVAAEAPGRAVFLGQGCGGCHTYEPAGSAANGTIGPDLDGLAADAQRAGQPLEPFVRESIVDPDKYIEPGFPKGVMPKSYAQLPANDLNALVEFLTTPQG